MIERQQDGGRIRTAAAEAAAHRQALVQADRRPLAATGRRLQQARGADGQVVVGRHAGRRGGKDDAPVGARGKMQQVAAVDEAEHRLQQVVAVGAAADDVQEEVELGRRRPGALPGPLAHGAVFHVSMRRRSSISLSRLSVTRSGRAPGALSG